MKKKFSFQMGGVPQAFGIEVPNIDLASASPIVQAASAPVDSGINTYLEFQQEDRYKKQFEASMKQQEAARKQQEIENQYKTASMDKGMLDDIIQIPVLGRNSDKVQAVKEKYFSQLKMDDHTPEGFGKRQQAYMEVFKDPAVLEAMRDQHVDKTLVDQAAKLTDDEKNASNFYSEYMPAYTKWKSDPSAPVPVLVIDNNKMAQIAKDKETERVNKNKHSELQNQQDALENQSIEALLPFKKAQAEMERIKMMTEEAKFTASGLDTSLKAYDAATDPVEKAKIVKTMGEQLRKLSDKEIDPNDIKDVPLYNFKKDLEAGIPLDKATARYVKLDRQLKASHAGGGGAPKETATGINPSEEKDSLMKEGWDGTGHVEKAYEETIDGQGHKVIKGTYDITQTKKPADMSGWSYDPTSKTFMKTVTIFGSPTTTTTGGSSPFKKGTVKRTMQ